MAGGEASGAAPPARSAAPPARATGSPGCGREAPPPAADRAGGAAVVAPCEAEPVGMVARAEGRGSHVSIRRVACDGRARDRGLGAGPFERLLSGRIGPERAIRLEAGGARASAFWTACGVRVWSTGLRRMGAEEERC